MRAPLARRLSPDSNSPEDCLCLAKGHACGMARPARLKADRVACINRIRGLLAEFGLVFAQSPAALQPVLTDVLEDASNEMNTLARLCVLAKRKRSGASSMRTSPGATSALLRTPKATRP